MIATTSFTIVSVASNTIITVHVAVTEHIELQLTCGFGGRPDCGLGGKVKRTPCGSCIALLGSIYKAYSRWKGLSIR